MSNPSKKSFECEHSSQSLTGGREVCSSGMFAFLESRPSDRRERAIRRSLTDGVGSLLNLHNNGGYSKRDIQYRRNLNSAENGQRNSFSAFFCHFVFTSNFFLRQPISIGAASFFLYWTGEGYMHMHLQNIFCRVHNNSFLSM